MAPPNLENDLHTSLSGSTVAESSMNSIGNSFEHINHEEIGKTLQALELLLSQARTPQLKDSLERLKLFLNKSNNTPFSVSEIYKNLIESLSKESNLDHAALCEVFGLDKKQAELDDAFDLDDLKEEKIAGFNKEKLLKMLDFSKVSYGDKDGKLTKDGYKTKRQFTEEDYQIIQFFEDERTENQYCPDENYKLEQRSYGYDLICSNSWNRDAGYIFIKGEEVTIAYHGTRDGSDIKIDLDAYLIKLPFLPEDNSVHSGFYSLFKRSWPSVHKMLQGLANERGSAIKDLKINITGHSMGGALASVAALCLNKTENAENVHVATFGSPRVFYKDAAKVYSDCLGKKTIRVACTSDNIPCVPFGGGHEYYKHVGQTLKLEANKTTLIPDATMYYHRLDTYRNLINELKQESFKSDNSPSWWYYLAYPTGRLLSNIPIKVSEDNDKEFFKKVEEENKDIKLSEIPIQYAPKLEEKIKRLEQEVAKLTNDETQLEERLNNIQQSLAEKTKELDDEKGKLTQEQQKISKFSDQVDKLTEALRGIEDQLAKKEVELDKQTSRVTELSNTVREFKKANTDLKGRIDNLNNQLAEEKEEKKVLEQLKVQSEQDNSELKRKIGELSSTKQKLDSQTSKIGELTAETEELRKIKTGLEGKAEFAEKALKDAQIELKENVGELDVAKENISQLEKKLKQAQQNLAKETNEIIQLKKGYSEIKAHLEERKNEIGELRGRVVQLTTQKNQLERQLNDARQSFTDQIMQHKNENNDLKTKLQEIENKSKVLEKNLQEQSESKNEELNEKSLEARIYSKKQGNYASVSFVLSGAFAVVASLTMFHLAICVSLIIAASTFLAVGCYCSYNANTALNNVEIENGSYRIAA